LPPNDDSPCSFTSNGLRLTLNSSEATSLAAMPSMSPIKRSVTW
jgi:hypothetical protein